MTEKDLYILKRKKVKVRLVEIAKYIGCTHGLLSQYENDIVQMHPNKVMMYREFIDSKYNK